MTQNIPLIQTDDFWQVLRDTVAAILAAEGANQVAQAEALPVDPAPWTFRVYSERANPIEDFTGDALDKTPLVNVWFDSSVFDKGKSNVSTRQQTEPTAINIDVYAYADSEETVGGHTPGDVAAAKKAQRFAMICRKILMHDKYRVMGLAKTVGGRWIRSISSFRPAPGQAPYDKIAIVRLILDISHIETIDLELENVLELLHIEMRFEPDGLIRAELEYDFTEEE